MGSTTCGTCTRRSSSATARSASSRARGTRPSACTATSGSFATARTRVRALPGLAPLRHRDFALYWVGQLVSLSGTWIELTATSWLLYQLTSSPLLLGVNGLVRAVPIIGLSLFGGAIADRVARKRLSSSVVTSLILGALVATNTLAFWHIYVIGFVNSTLAAFDTPARQALFPTLVPRGQMQNAVALNSMLFRISTLIGPPVAGLLIAGVSTSAPFFVNAASYVTIIVALVAIRAPEMPRRSQASLRADVAGGLRYAFASPILPLILAVEACLSIFGHNSALTTIFARDVFGVGAEGLGILLGAVGAGALLGMVTLVAVGDVRRKGTFMVAAGLVYSATLVAFAFSRSFALSVAVLFVLGLADATWGTMRNAIAQLATSDAYRGRVMSLIVITSRGLTQASQLQTGAAVALFGPAVAAAVGGAVIGLTVLGVAARSPRLRRFAGAAPPGLEPAAVAAAGGGD
ncbi:MAG: MFS transporter [Chloroflexi bacterium]|nr:MAG: MFS transporter [Chloroflexota bacterium]